MGKILSGIKGERFPLIGKQAQKYSVTFDESADIGTINDDEILWQIYAANEYDKYEKVPFSGQKKGKLTTYTFFQKLLNKNLQLQATYKNETVELHITPQENGEIKIIDVFFLDIEYKIREKDNLKYMNSVNLQIYTLNMLDKYVDFKIFGTLNGTEKELYKSDQPLKIEQKNGIVKTKKSILLSPAMYIQTQQDLSASVHSYRIKVWETDNENNFYEEGLIVKNEMGKMEVPQDSQTPVKTGTSEPVKKEEEKKDEKCACSRPITKDELKAIAIHATQANIDKHYEGIVKAMKKFEINTCIRISHFLAQVLEESGHLKYTKESGNETYLSVYKGWHGRGLIQLTTESNYKAFGKAIDEDVISTSTNRDKLLNNPYASYSAAWFFSEKAELNDDADNNDFMNIVYTVNGGFNHYDERLNSLKKGFDVLYKNCKTSKDLKPSYIFRESKIYNRMKACIGWGLWHDKNRKNKKDGCKDDDMEAVAGYERFIQLHDSNPPRKKFDKAGKEIFEKWYGLTREAAEKNLNAIKR